MTAAFGELRRWVGMCGGCGRPDVEVEPRRTHHERALCDRCADEPFRITIPHDPPPLAVVGDGESQTESRADRYAGRLYDWGQLVIAADRPIPWRIEGLVVDGHLSLLAAVGGEGKSILTMAALGAVAKGSPLAGMACAAGVTVLFDAENGPWVLGDRARQLDPPMHPDLVFAYDVGGLVLTDLEDFAWLRGLIIGHGARLVVFDSLRALTPGTAENDSDEMAPVIVALRELARATEAAVILIHHRGKSRELDFRGSSAIRDQVDLAFVLERDDRDPERKTRRRLRCVKCRIAPEPDDRWISIKGWRGQLTIAEAAPFEPPSERAPTKSDAIAEPILNAIQRAGSPMRQKAIAEAIGRNRDGTLRRALEQLVEAGDLVLTSDGHALPEMPSEPGPNRVGQSGPRGPEEQASGAGQAGGPKDEVFGPVGPPPSSTPAEDGPTGWPKPDMNGSAA